MHSSTYMFVHERIAPAHFEYLAGCGVVGVEIFCSPGHFDWHSRRTLGETLAFADATGVKIHSFHAPWDEKGTFDIASSSVARRRRALAEMQSAIDGVAALGGTVMVMHPGYASRAAASRSLCLSVAVDCLHELVVYGHKSGVTIAIENSCPSDPGCEAEEWAWVAGELAGTTVCLDTGHASLARGGVDAFVFPGLVPAQIHLSDTRGTADDHLLPGEGTIDWGSFYRKAKDAYGAAAVHIVQILELGTPPSAPVFREYLSRPDQMLIE